MDHEIGREELVRERLSRNGLAGGFPDAASCCSALLGVQNQVPRYAALSLFNRVSRLRRKDLEESFSDLSIVAMWGQRRTLHLYSRDDADLVCSLFHDRNYVGGSGKAENESMEALGRALAAGSGVRLGKDVLLDAIISVAPDVAGAHPFGTTGAMQWLTNNGVLQGVPGASHVSEFVLAGGYDDMGAEDSIIEAMRRYFRRFGPATLKDFCHWSGIPQRDVKAPFTAIGDELDRVVCEGRVLYSLGTVAPVSTRAVSVLGMYDPLTLSYADKSWVGGRDVQDRIWMSAGRVGSVVLIGGRVRATWTVGTEGGRAVFAVDPLGPVSEHYRRRISARMSLLAGFIGKGYGGTVFRDGDRPGMRRIIVWRIRPSSPFYRSTP